MCTQMCNVWNSCWVKLLKERENIKETDDCMSNKDSGIRAGQMSGPCPAAPGH